MASITSTGIGSGLDIAGIVQQLVTAEGQPVETRISKQESKVQVRLSAFGSLKSALSDFRDAIDAMKDANKFLVRKAVSGDDAILTATAGTTAVPASYSVEVLQKAQAQKLSSGTFTDSAAAVGTGTLVVSVGSSAFEVEITSEDDPVAGTTANNTLAGIRDAINAAVDNTGVAATIVNADDGSHLILTSEKTGESNAITVTQSGGDGGLASLEYDPGNGLNALTELSAAQDAHIQIDGYDVYSDTNTFSNAIDGVAIDLVAAAPGNTISLDVTNDTQAVRETVQKFVDEYNNLVDLFDQLTSYDVDKKSGGPLLGDATARTIRDQIRRELSTAVTDTGADFSSLSEVGIRVQVDGKLEIDDAALSTTMANDFTSFGRLFAAGDGYAVRLSDLTSQYLDSEGILESRTAGLKAQIDDIGKQRDALNERLSHLQDRLYKQFNALDSLLGQLNQTSNFLAQQLNSLPGFTTPTKSQ